jgi:hypothetical protein
VSLHLEIKVAEVWVDPSGQFVYCESAFSKTRLCEILRNYEVSTAHSSVTIELLTHVDDDVCFNQKDVENLTRSCETACMFKKWDAGFLQKNWFKTSLPPLNPKVPFLQKAYC